MRGEVSDTGTRGKPSEVYAALADPSRRQMIARLARGPATTGQLAEMLPITRPAVSQHLRVLQGAGLVATTAIGRHRWHELVPAALLTAAQWAGEMVERHAEAPPLRPPGDGPGDGRDGGRDGGRGE